MLNHQYTTVRNLPLSEIYNPKHLEALLEYAGELDPPCVAEGLMNRLNRAPKKLGLLVDADVDVLIRKSLSEGAFHAFVSHKAPALRRQGLVIGEGS